MTETQFNASEWLPLREPTFLILLSLAQREKHGYAIMQDIEELSHKRVKLSTGTLYEALIRLLDQALIERIDEPGPGKGNAGSPRNHPGRPRKSYRLTPMGRRVLQAEANRMQTLAAATQRRLKEEQV